MCECNCSQGPDYFFPGPDGITYGLELYRGCMDCSAGPGITLYRIPDKAMEYFAPSDFRVQPPWTGAPGWDEVRCDVVNEESFAKAVREDDYGDLVSLANDEVDDELAREIATLALRALCATAFRGGKPIHE